MPTSWRFFLDRGPRCRASNNRFRKRFSIFRYDKQIKYQAALNYLATQLGVKICGRPCSPTMELAYFGAGEFLYVGDDGSLSNASQNAIPLYSFHHVFDFKWKSSTGNMLSLQQVGTQEWIKYRTDPTGAPFNEAMAGTPSEFTWGRSTTGANSGMGRDDHSTKPPALICRDPFVEAEVVAEQWYQYSVDSGTTWVNIPGAAYLLIKGVRRVKGQWVFYFIKQNWPENNSKKFKFEVEYKLEQPVPAPRVGQKFNRTNGTRANIKDYAHRVVSTR